MVTTKNLRLYEVEAPQANMVDTVQENYCYDSPKATSHKNPTISPSNKCTKFVEMRWSDIPVDRGINFLFARRRIFPVTMEELYDQQVRENFFFWIQHHIELLPWYWPNIIKYIFDITNGWYASLFIYKILSYFIYLYYVHYYLWNIFIIFLICVVIHEIYYLILKPYFYPTRRQTRNDMEDFIPLEMDNNIRTFIELGEEQELNVQSDDRYCPDPFDNRVIQLVIPIVNLESVSRQLFDDSDSDSEIDIAELSIQSDDLETIEPIVQPIDIDAIPVINYEECIRAIDFDSVQSSNIDLLNFVKQNDWCIKLIEDAITFYKGVLPHIRKDGIIDWNLIKCVTLSYWRGRSTKSLLLSALESDFVTQLDEMFSNLDDDEVEVQSIDFENVIKRARCVLDTFDDLKQSVFFKKIYKLIMYGMAHSLFDKIGLSMSFCGFNLFQQEAIKRKHHLGGDFVHVLCDSLLFLLEKGFQIIQTGSIDCIYHSSQSYADFHNRANKIKRDYISITNPEANGFDEHSFRKELDDLIEKGEAMSKFSNTGDTFEKKVLNNYLHELLLIKATLNTKAAAREPRAVPFSILINGESGIAKSTIKEILFTHYGKVNDLDTHSTYCYTRNPVAKYWDGFTTSQWCVILDDVAFMHPNKAPMGDPSVMEFIQIINPTPFTPDQADLSDKGRTPLRAKLVIATTNTKHLNAHFYFSCASAVQRRFPFIVTPSVKKEYRCDDSMMLDPSKLPKFTGYPDIWTWTVDKVVPISVDSDKRCAEFANILTDCDLKTFLVWYNNTIKKFNDDQIQMMDSLKEISELNLCLQCHLPNDICDCINIQSVDISLSYYLSIFINWLVKIIFNIYLNYPIFRYFLSYFSIDVILRRQAFNLVDNMIFRFLGERAQISIGYPTIFASLIAMVTAVSALYKTYNLFNVQGGDQSIPSSDTGKKPIGDGDRENVWYKEEFSLNPMDFTNTSKSSKGLSRTQMENILMRSLVHIGVFNKKDTLRSARATCVKGQVYMTNNHIINIIPEGETRTMILKFNNSANGVSENITLQIDESLITRYPEGDILLIRLPIPNKKGVYDYLPNQTLSIKDNGYYISRDQHGCKQVLDVRCIRQSKREVYTHENVLYSYIPLIGSTSKDTENGDCGSLLVAETHYGTVIIGMHVRLLIGDMNVMSVPVDRFIVDRLIAKFPPQFHEGYVAISAPSAKREIVSLHKKSPIRYIPDGTASVVGSFAGFRPHLKSRVTHTPMSYHLSDYKIKYGAPLMKGWEPWYKAAKDLLQPTYTYNPKILQEVSKSFANDIVSQLSKEDFNKLHVYDDFTTINGAAGVRFVDKINRATSAGLPWRKQKINFMTAYDVEMFGLPNAVKVDSEIMNRVEEMKQQYLDGYTCHPITCGNLKDEPRPFAKIASGSTRLFNGAPFDFIILMRKYYLPIVRLVQTKQYLFEACPGLVAQSEEWHNLYKHLTQHGEDRMIAGDFASFDKSMIAAFTLEAFQILIDICKASGNFSDDDIKIMFGISYDISFPMIDLNGDLLRVWCSNPSGHPLTVIINCIVNSLYMRYAYYVNNPDKESHTFKRNVVLSTYGDDNVINVSKKINWFSHTTIQNALEEIGVTYTMADKVQESIPFINMSDVTFLKRRWRFDEDVGKYLCPLEFESIEKQLMTWTRSKNVSEQEQGISIIESVVREWWFYGKNIFEENRLKMKQLVEDLDWKLWVQDSTFPTWEQLFDDYKRNSLSIIPQSKSIRLNKKQNLERIKHRLDLRVNALIEAAEKMVLEEVPVGGIRSLTPESETSSIIFIDYDDECVLGDMESYSWV